LRDVFRSGFKGKLLGFAYSVNQKLVESIPGDVAEGVYTIAPSSAEGSPALKRVMEIAKTPNPDPYTAQVYDQINLVLMAMAFAKDTSGQSVKDAIRKVSQGGGKKVTGAVEAIKAIGAGEKVDYEGASGPCDFTDAGDISDAQFRYEQVKGGKITLLKVA
jgi:branched-chain amino acid transport system substrate-binding protein